ncbi:MAG: hypothetical protein KC503_46850 [Myxococcales bacterium]|nr:hypothetical protein [Myxococcales bacterium]
MKRLWLCAFALLAAGACFGGFDGPPPKSGTAKGSSGGSGAGRGSGSGTATDGDSKKQKQSYKEAWALICDAEKRSGASSADRTERGAEVATWIVRNLTNRRARYWFIAFGRAKKEQRELLFLAEAKRAGIGKCALRDLLFDAGAAAPTSAPASAPSSPPSGAK